MPMLDAALDYARRGVPVFPCKPDKTPVNGHSEEIQAIGRNSTMATVQFPRAYYSAGDGAVCPRVNQCRARPEPGSATDAA
jgi:hypothetical protein